MKCPQLAKKAVGLFDRLFDAFESRRWLQVATAICVFLMLTCFGVCSLMDEWAALESARKVYGETRQQIAAMPQSAQIKVAGRLLELSKKRLDGTGDAADHLFKQLFEMSQHWLVAAKEGGAVASQPKRWEKELYLLQEVQLQIAVLPEDLPEAVKANEFLAKAEARLIALHHPEGYADKDVQDWYGSARHLAAEAEKRRARIPRVTFQINGGPEIPIEPAPDSL